MVKMLIVLISTIYNSQVFLQKKMQMQKLLTFFSKNISAYAIFNDQSFNDMLTNDVSFEQLGPVCCKILEDTVSKSADSEGSMSGSSLSTL